MRGAHRVLARARYKALQQCRHWLLMIPGQKSDHTFISTTWERAHRPMHAQPNTTTKGCSTTHDLLSLEDA